MRGLDENKLTFYPADQPNGIGILVVPGGGYHRVVIDPEGLITKNYLVERGYDVWILDYSTGSTSPTPLYPRPLDEALEAVRYIRAQNRCTKLGIWGYSAGGHLAAVTVTNPEARLDFGVLGYAVITMDPVYTHAGSRLMLLGENPSPELEWQMSAQNRVTDSTPPIFLFHTANDHTVCVENALFFSRAMAAHKRPFQSLILPDGPHGLNLALNDPVRNWTAEVERWLKYSI